MKPNRTLFRGAATLVLLLAWAVPAGATERLDFDQMYTYGVTGLKFTPKLVGLASQPVIMTGFMAPLLRVQSDFFVLSNLPVTLCPFCGSDSDWPTDIVVVYFKTGQIFRQLNRAIDVKGRLEIGSYTDANTGFVSLVRLMDAEVID